MSRSVRLDYEALRTPCTCPPSVYNPRQARPTNPDCKRHGKTNND